MNEQEVVEKERAGGKGKQEKSTRIFYLNKSTITLMDFYLSTRKVTGIKIDSRKSKKELI